MNQPTEKKVQVEFTRGYTVKSCDGKSFKQGQKIALPESSAKHFINRGVAQLVVKNTSEK